MVEVFSTNITEPSLALSIKQALLQLFPKAKINFDLQDCDRILRIVNAEPIGHQTIAWMRAAGYCCEELPDIVPAKNEFQMA